MFLGSVQTLSGGLFGWGRGYAGELSMEEFVMVEENFHVGGTGFFSIFLKTMKK